MDPTACTDPSRLPGSLVRLARFHQKPLPAAIACRLSSSALRPTPNLLTIRIEAVQKQATDLPQASLPPTSRIAHAIEDHDQQGKAMNSHSRSVSVASINSLPTRRTSASSRLSYAVNSAERGEPQNGAGIAAEHQIEEEIAEIKRYEVRAPHPGCFAASGRGPLLMLSHAGLLNNR